jgi:hypothetical protein
MQYALLSILERAGTFTFAFADLRPVRIGLLRRSLNYRCNRSEAACFESKNAAEVKSSREIRSLR